MDSEAREWLDKRLDKIELKQDAMVERQAEMNTTLRVQATSLEHHIRRTDLAEEAIKRAKTEADGALKPVQDFVTFHKNLYRLVLALSAVAAAGLGLLKALGKL